MTAPGRRTFLWSICVRHAGPLLLLAWLVCVAIITLMPFDFTAASVGARLQDMFVEHRLARRAPDVVLNLLLFVPFGALLHAEGQRRRVGLAVIVGSAAAGAALLASAIELLQLFLPSRFPSVLDIAANVAGALTGVVYGHAAWAERLTGAIARARRSTRRRWAAALMLSTGGLALATSAALQARTRLSNWNENYPFLVGNEVTGDRAWRGRIFALELSDAATPLASMRRFADGGILAVPGARVADFEFSGAGAYGDRAGRIPDLAWTGPSSGERTGGVRLSDDAWLRTDGAATDLVRALRRSNELTLRVRAASDTTRDWRGRIVSNSLDTGERNFTLEQWREHVVFRLRTPHTGENANRPELVIEDVFSDDLPRDIVVTYDGATILAAVAASGAVHRLELGPGSSLASLWYPGIRGSDVQKYKLTYLGGLFVAPGVLISMLGRNGRIRLGWSVLWIAGFTAAFEATLILVSGRAVDELHVATTAATGALVLAATNALPACIRWTIPEHSVRRQALPPSILNVP